MAKQTNILITLRLRYSGEPVDPQDVKGLVESSLEHMRAEGTLSDPHGEVSCDWAQATSVVVEP